MHASKKTIDYPALTSAVLGGYLERLLDGVIIFTEERRVKAFNARYTEMSGLGPDEIQVGDTLEHVLRKLSLPAGPNHREDDAETVIAERLAIWGTDANQFERRDMPSGQVVEIYRSKTAEGDLVCVHLDVTDRIRGEEQLERQRTHMANLLQNTSDGVTLVDPEGRFIAFNDRFLEFYGIDPGDVAWGISFDELAEEFRDLDGLSERTRQDEIEGRRRFATDPTLTRIQRQLFTGRTLEIVKTILSDGGCVMTMRDITDELLIRQELETARRRAEEASSTKSRFLARMSHEMRTPLNGILGVTALAESQNADPKQAEYLSVIRNSGTLLLRLIEDLLEATRVDNDGFALLVEPFAIDQIVSDAVQLTMPAAVEKAIQLRIIHSGETPPELMGDPVRVKQILLNLTTNAIKFTNEGGVTVTLDCQLGDEQADISISVRDTGIGISPDEQAKIFTQFYQIEGADNRRFGGVGLGLAICEKLVEGMGGRIGVRSASGEGSVFTVAFSLPFAGSDPDGNGAPAGHLDTGSQIG